MRAKELTKLKLAPSHVFLDLEESKKTAKPTLDLSQVVFTIQMRAKQCSLYREDIPHQMKEHD
jgi:hypothetical protein